VASQRIQYFGDGTWLGFPGSAGGPNSCFAGPFAFDTEFWGEPSGDPEVQNASRFDFEVIWCGNPSCTGLRDTNQDVPFNIRANDLPHNVITLNSQQIATIKSSALSALQTAFAPYNVHVGSGREGSNTVYIVGDQPAIACGATEGNDLAVSRVYYQANISQA